MKLNINTWRIIGLLAIIIFTILFFKIFIYIAISMVLFLLGYPIAYRLGRLGRGRWMMPPAVASLLTLGLMAAVVFCFCYIMLPPLIMEVRFLSDLNFQDVMENMLAQYPSVKKLMLRFGDPAEVEAGIAAQLKTYMNAENLGMLASEIFGYSGAIIGGTLCVLFITFFLLKDQRILQEGISLISPSGYETEVVDISRKSKRMLSSYFTALFADMFIVGGAAMVTLSLLGIKNAVIIGFCAGVLNVIPYIGSFITMIVAITLGVSSCISAGSYELIGPTVNRIFFGLLTINLADAFIIQPFLFSNSVKAHPLEVFIVTLMAGSIGGILGMVVALPVYTILRIIAKEFLTRFKFFDRISQRI